MLTRMPKWVGLGGILLSFTAGFINVIAFLSFAQQAATHMTGILTHISIHLASRHLKEAHTALLNLGFFFLGAIVCGLIVKASQFKLGRRYGFALSLECLLLALSTWAFARHSIYGEYLACMATGLQNAMVSTLSGAIVRTTHMTGILTDLGALIGQRLRGVRVSSDKFWLLLGILLAFFAGGYIGAFAYESLIYYAMIIPCAITGLCAIGYWILLARHKQLGH